MLICDTLFSTSTFFLLGKHISLDSRIKMSFFIETNDVNDDSSEIV